jgi:dicarboxylate transporter 10
MYEGLKEKAAAQGTPSFLLLMAISAVSGAAGGLVGNPADVVNVRLQSRQTRHQGGFLDTIRAVGRDGGVRGYFRGVGPNCARAAVMTSCQLGAYDSFKMVLTQNLGMPDDRGTQLLSSVLAALLATTLCSPMDVLKTHLMGSTGVEKPSAARIFKRLMVSDGMRWMFRGWLPSFVRLGPHTAATMLLLEQQRRLYRRYYSDDM